MQFHIKTLGVFIGIFILFGLNLQAQKPKWLKQKVRESEFKKEVYLTGFIYDNKMSDEGIASSLDRVKVMAKAEIADNLVSEVQTEKTLNTFENEAGASQTFKSNIVSETKAEIYSMTVESYYDKDENLVYGFAYVKRDDVVQYYKTNIDKYMQEIRAHLTVSDGLVQQKKLDEAKKELEKNQALFNKIEFASDFIVLIKSMPLDNGILMAIRNQKYEIDGKKAEIERLKTAALFVLECNFEKFQILPEDLNGTYTWANAKSTCENLVAFDYTDWILPSRQVLNEIYGRKNEIKNFSNQGAYWSSDENGETAWGKQFSAEGMSGYGNKAGVARVRCIRKTVPN